jgi:hypothetical protein
MKNAPEDARGTMRLSRDLVRRVAAGLRKARRRSSAFIGEELTLITATDA